MLRRRGFTLIELLVVIAIIGILAAMLFPVFARARESARKTQCLANVKNIAIAFNMYFTDYDAFPPAEKSPAAFQLFVDLKGCDMDNFTSGCCSNATLANPYLRWPVVLDDYTRNRDIWRCPSARYPATAAWIVPSSDWMTALKNSNCNCVCQVDWPVGWGGTVTDSFADGTTGSVGTGAFEVDYHGNEREDLGKKLSAINDPSHHFVVAERSIKPDYWRIEQIAYPESCRIFTDRILEEPADCAADWVNCSDSQGCSADPKNPLGWWGEESKRKAMTRHMGGNNLGFADGHAKWMPAGAMIAAANADPQELEPIGPQPSYWPNANPNP